MKTITEINEEILQEWKASDQERFNDAVFTSDGMVCDNETWEKSPLRILYITKDQNAKGGSAWDLCDENITLKSLNYKFFQNLLYTLYGLGHTTPEYKQTYNFTNQQTVEYYNSCAVARINAKKRAGGPTLPNSVLSEYLTKDKDYIKRQILNLNPDIIVCCGYSEGIENTGNLLLNFLIENCYTDLKKASNDNWVYYDEKSNKVAINSWHISYPKIDPKDFYTEMIDAYYSFLQNHPDFTNNHRK